jgi:hypothetical protein
MASLSVRCSLNIFIGNFLWRYYDHLMSNHRQLLLPGRHQGSQANYLFPHHTKHGNCKQGSQIFTLTRESCQRNLIEDNCIEISWHG